MHDNREPSNYGYEAGKDAAVASALRAIASLDGAPSPYPFYPRSAAEWHRVLVARARQKRGRKAGGASTIEYVYYVSRGEYPGEEWSAVPVRIIKKTKKRVFIPKHYINNDKAGYSYADVVISETIVLDRQELETKGYATARGQWWQTFYREPPQRSSGKGPPPHLVEHIEMLGLSWPYTEDAIKQAYRVKAREHHPDTGGDAQAFKAARKAFEVLSVKVNNR
jgi:hypothetical protein